MGTFRLSSWCIDRSLIPHEVDFHIVEPNDPPSALVMAAPERAVAPPHVAKMVHPLIVHVTRFTDFRGQHLGVARVAQAEATVAVPCQGTPPRATTATLPARRISSTVATRKARMERVAGPTLTGPEVGLGSIKAKR